MQEAFYGVFSELREHGTLRESAREPLQLVDDFIACIQLAVGAQVRAVRLLLARARATPAALASTHPVLSTWRAGDGQPSGAARRDAQAVHAGVPLEHAAPPIHTQHGALEDTARVARRAHRSGRRGAAVSKSPALNIFHRAIGGPMAQQC